MMDESKTPSLDLWGGKLKFGESFVICTRGPEGLRLPLEKKECMTCMCKLKKRRCMWSKGVCVCIDLMFLGCVCGDYISGWCKAVYRRSQMRARQFEAGNE